jgi:glycosyltransferase involved in cell wall biosynthesis
MTNNQALSESTTAADNQNRLVSIGMPVRNEARFLRKALDALLAQTGVPFEIIISDNASTDSTPDICREYAERFPEIVRLNCFQQNIGASANFAWVLQQAKGAYFMWAAGHDIWAPDYLQQCSEALESNPRAMIAFGTTRWIDEQDRPYHTQTGWTDTRGLSLPGRYFTVFWGNMNPILGLMRTPAIRQQPFNDMVGVDLAILLALALRGDFLHCTATGWNRREFRHEVSYSEKLKRYRSKDYALSTSFLGRYFPLARLPLRIYADLWKSDIGPGNRLLLSALLVCALPAKYLTDKARKKQKSRAEQGMEQAG